MSTVRPHDRPALPVRPSRDDHDAAERSGLRAHRQTSVPPGRGRPACPPSPGHPPWRLSRRPGRLIRCPGTCPRGSSGPVSRFPLARRRRDLRRGSRGQPVFYRVQPGRGGPEDQRVCGCCTGPGPGPRPPAPRTAARNQHAAFRPRMRARCTRRSRSRHQHRGGQDASPAPSLRRSGGFVRVPYDAQNPPVSQKYSRKILNWLKRG
jgi:hypothetical protein